MGRKMYDKCQELLKNIKDKHIILAQLATEIAKKIGGDRRTQISYINFMTEQGMIKADKVRPGWYDINKDVLKDDIAE